MIPDEKIVILIDGLTIAGAEKQALILSNELSSTNSVSLIYIKESSSDEMARVRSIIVGANEERVDIGRLSIKRFFNLLFRNDYILITFAVKANLIGRVLKFFNKEIKLITSIRNERFSNKLVSFAYKFTCFVSDVTVYNSKAALYTCTNNGYSRLTKSKYINNYVDTCSKKIKKKQGIVNIGYFGRLVAQKRIDMLLKAFHKLINRGYNLTLSIHGHGPQDAELKLLASTLGIGDYVKFIGSYKNISDYSDNVDLVVLPSEWEGMPNVVLECGMLGLPVIGSDAGGMRDIENDLRSNQFVRLNNCEDLYFHIVNSLAVPLIEIEEMCKRLRQYLEDNHSREVINSKWREVLNNA